MIAESGNINFFPSSNVQNSVVRVGLYRVAVYLDGNHDAQFLERFTNSQRQPSGNAWDA